MSSLNIKTIKNKNLYEFSSITNTQLNILISAEYMFGHKGINSTSTRDINLHSTEKNASSVSYHFGNKENLIDFILAYRMSELELIRMKEYDKLLKKTSSPSKKDLIKLILRPIINKISKDPLWKNFIPFYEQVIVFNESQIIQNRYMNIVNNYAKGTLEIYKRLKSIHEGKPKNISDKKRHDFLCFFICSLSHSRKTNPQIINHKNYIDYLEKISLDILLS